MRTRRGFHREISGPRWTAWLAWLSACCPNVASACARTASTSMPAAGQRGPVQVAEQSRASQPGQLRLDTGRGQAVFAERGAGRVIGGGQREQDVLAAQVAVAEPDGMVEGPHPDRAGVRVEVPGFRRRVHIVSLC